MTEQAPYSVYDHLRAHDVIEMLKPLLDQGGWNLRDVDGKLFVRHPSVARETPWIHVKHEPGYECGLWHQITFNLISMQLPAEQRFVPRACQNCWKVVLKPRTLEQLFNVLEMQRRMDRPCKCGIEPRQSVHGLYGAYWYNIGKDAGLECYMAVYREVAAIPVLAPLLDEVDADGRTTRLMLKRACTEFEHACGPSDKWIITEQQNRIEDLVARWVSIDDRDIEQPKNLIWNIQRRWIEWAWQYGDPTYAKYTGGAPLYPPYVTYHPAVRMEDDE